MAGAFGFIWVRCTYLPLSERLFHWLHDARIRCRSPVECRWWCPCTETYIRWQMCVDAKCREEFSPLTSILCWGRNVLRKPDLPYVTTNRIHCVCVCVCKAALTPPYTTRNLNTTFRVFLRNVVEFTWLHLQVEYLILRKLSKQFVDVIRFN